jgi:hypothetical protein
MNNLVSGLSVIYTAVDGVGVSSVAGVSGRHNRIEPVRIPYQKWIQKS